MASVGYVVKTMTLLIGTTAYETAITGITENHTRPSQSTATADGSTKTDIGNDEATLDITFNIDVAATSLYTHLMDNGGDAATIKWTPDTTQATRKRSAPVILAEPTGTFDVNSFATATVTLPVTAPITWVTS
jgi:hypothetical protein